MGDWRGESSSAPLVRAILRTAPSEPASARRMTWLSSRSGELAGLDAVEAWPAIASPALLGKLGRDVWDRARAGCGEGGAALPVAECSGEGTDSCGGGGRDGDSQTGMLADGAREDEAWRETFRTRSAVQTRAKELAAATSLERQPGRCHCDERTKGPNVRHERRRKGREAAFGTSARWRG